MNRDCHGDLFTFRGHRLYCCFAGSEIIDAQGLNNGDECPACAREIKTATLPVEPTKVETVTFITLPGRGDHIEMPSGFLAPREPIAPLTPPQTNESH